MLPSLSVYDKEKALGTSISAGGILLLFALRTITLVLPELVCNTPKDYIVQQIQNEITVMMIYHLHIRHTNLHQKMQDKIHEIYLANISVTLLLLCHGSSSKQFCFNLILPCRCFIKIYYIIVINKRESFFLWVIDFHVNCLIELITMFFRSNNHKVCNKVFLTVNFY